MAASSVIVSLPTQLDQEILAYAAETNRRLNEIYSEAFRKYRALRNFEALSREVQKVAKRENLTPEDFGGFSEEDLDA